MLEKGRQRMIAGVNRVGGRADCSEAVVLQQRNGVAVIAFLVVFVVAMTAIQTTIDLPALVSGGIAGLIVGVGITMLTTSYWLGHCGDEVLLVTTNRFQNKPVEVTARYGRPVAAAIGSGIIARKVQVDGIDYLMPKQLEERFRAVTGT